MHLSVLVFIKHGFIYVKLKEGEFYGLLVFVAKDIFAFVKFSILLLFYQRLEKYHQHYMYQTFAADRYGPEVIKKSCSTQLSMKFFLFIYVKISEPQKS